MSKIEMNMPKRKDTWSFIPPHNDYELKVSRTCFFTHEKYKGKYLHRVHLAGFC